MTAEEPEPDSLDAAIADYLRRIDAGNAPDRAAFLAAHLNHADGLRSFFRDQDRFEPIVPVQAVDPNATIAPPADAGESPRVIRYFGDYELLEEIARGGMGVVFRARQVSLNRIVALKMILAGNLANVADVARFRAEAEAAANLDHPNILPIYEVGAHEGQHYFSMKLIDGGDLAAKIKSSTAEDAENTENQSRVKFSALSASSAVELLSVVSRAVHYAHQRGILHRDLKPANILLDAEGTPYVTDFGLAKRVEGDSGLTQSGAIIGTPSYMAPEQARAEKQLSTAVDVYGLGAILYECLTGRPPFRAATPLDTVLQVLEQEPERPMNCDRDLSTIALKCLEKSPARRYDSAGAFADDLDRWTRGEPIRARRAGRTERAWKWVKRRPALTGFLLLLIATWTLGTALVFRQWRETRQQLYYNRIALALREVEANNEVRAKVLLDECPAGLRGWDWRYVRRLCYASPHVTLPKQASYIERVAWSPDGKRIATIAQDDTDKGQYAKRKNANEVRVWDVETGRKVLTLAHAGPVLGLAYRPDGSQVATVCSAEVSIWDLATGKTSQTFAGEFGEIACVAFSSDQKYIAAAGRKGAARIWDVRTRHEVLAVKLPPDKSPIAGLAFSPENQFLVLALEGEIARVCVWSLVANQEVKTLTFYGRIERNSCASRSALSPDSRRVAWMSMNGREVQIADIGTGRVIASLRIETTDWYGGMAFSPDGQKFAVGIHRPFVNAVLGAALLPGQVTNPYLLEDVSGKSIAVFDAATGRQIQSLRGHDGFAEGLAFSPDARRLVVVGGNAYRHPRDAYRIQTVHGETTVWDVATSSTALVMRSDIREIGRLAFSLDGQRLLVQHNTAPEHPERVWNVLTGTQVPDPASEDWPTEPKWSADGKRRVEPDNKECQGGVKVVNRNSEVPEVEARLATEFSLNVWHNAILNAVFSPDGKRVAGGCANGSVYIWNAGNGRELLKIQGHHNGVSSVVFSPDGTMIVSGSADGTAKLWNSATGQEILTLTSPDGPIVRVAFSPDGHRIAAATTTGTFRVWDGSPMPDKTGTR